MATVEEARQWLRAVRARKSDFYQQYDAEISALVSECKKSQGEYIPAFHGSGSWATTYSAEFVAASARLYLLLESLTGVDPITELSELFRQHEIRSCRGSTMESDKVEYLYVNHLRHYIRSHP